jgi:hypothetical protein
VRELARRIVEQSHEWLGTDGGNER